MLLKSTMMVGLVVAFSVTTAYAQSEVRNPVLGDPGASVQTRTKQTPARAKAIAKSDKQGPGTENGNQPDRAAAAGGGR